MCYEARLNKEICKEGPIAPLFEQIQKKSLNEHVSSSHATPSPPGFSSSSLTYASSILAFSSSPSSFASSPLASLIYNANVGGNKISKNTINGTWKHMEGEGLSSVALR